MHTELLIPARFNGPPESGNGGYSCGVIANYIDGAAQVRLHVPPPLDKTLTVKRDEDGAVKLHYGEILVGSGKPVELALEVPAPPSLAEAEDAMSRYPAKDNHLFPTCFVCGNGRPHHDGLELYSGPVKDWSLLACVWQPQPDLLDEARNVREEILWSALDCPGYFAATGGDMPAAVLGQLEGEIKTQVSGDAPLIVYAWPMGRDGRKYYGGTAVATASGEVVACAKTTWIELKG